MSYEIIEFKPEHVAAMKLQHEQVQVLSYLTEPYLEALAQGLSATAVADGRVIACAGIATAGYGVGTLWAFIARDAGSHFVRLDRSVRRMMRMIPLRRIEASAEVDFTPACRWLTVLGFIDEGVLHRYGPDGADHRRYAWLSPYP